MNSRLRFLVGFLFACDLVISAAPEAYGSRGPMPILQPKAYSSPSGRFKLDVNPSSKYGAGPGTYRLTRDGQVIWSGERPFTLQDAAISDEGEVVGYSYSAGSEWEIPNQGHGDFRVVIIDPAGHLRLDDSEPRKPSLMFDAPSYPVGAGILLDPANDRCILRTHEEFGFDQVWRIYRLSYGERLSRFSVKRTIKANEDRYAYVVDLRLIRGTPLILTHWDTNLQERGGKFLVFDGKGEVVWRLDLPKDYAGMDQVPTAILRADEPGKFDVRLVAAKKRVSFQVKPKEGDEAGWRVIEIGRSDYPPATTHPADSQPATRPVTSQPAVPSLELKPAGRIVLGNEPAGAGTAHRVIDFDLDADGRIGLIRQGAQETCSFVLMATDGKVIREVRLEGMASPKAAWVQGERWIVAAGPKAAGDKAMLCWLDAGTFKLEKIRDHQIKGIGSIAGDRQGGFVVLTKVHERNTITETLVGFSAQGKPQWTIHENSGDETALFSPRDVTVTTAGKVAVLCGIRNQVQLYDRDGKHLDTIRLAEVMEQKPNYPTDISVDVDGGLIVRDFQGSPEIWRIAANGKVASGFTPQHADGRSFPANEGVKAGPKGELWTTDGTALLRLKKNGVVEQVFGERPNSDQLGEISALAMDRHGHFYAVSQRTANVHVFDENGRPLRMLKPLPTDFASNQAPDRITVSGSGEVYMASFSTGYLHFGLDGQRIRFESSNTMGSEIWACPPASQERWVASRDKLVLMAGDGDLNRVIDRRPAGTWLEKVEQIAFAADGTAAVAASSSSDWGQGTTINLYTKAGDPLRTIPVPGGGWIFGLAFDGKTVIASRSSGLLAFTAEGTFLGTLVFRVDGTSQGQEYWQPFFSPDGKAILLFRRGTHDVYRYEWMP